MRLTGSQIFVEVLIEQGVDLFPYQRASSIPARQARSFVFMDYPLLYRVLRPRSSHIRPAFSVRAADIRLVFSALILYDGTRSMGMRAGHLRFGTCP